MHTPPPLPPPPAPAWQYVFLALLHQDMRTHILISRVAQNVMSLLAWLGDALPGSLAHDDAEILRFRQSSWCRGIALAHP